MPFERRVLGFENELAEVRLEVFWGGESVEVRWFRHCSWWRGWCFRVIGRSRKIIRIVVSIGIAGIAGSEWDV